MRLADSAHRATLRTAINRIALYSLPSCGGSRTLRPTRGGRNGRFVFLVERYNLLIIKANNAECPGEASNFCNKFLRAQTLGAVWVCDYPESYPRMSCAGAIAVGNA